VARRNVADYKMEDRIALYQGDLYAPLPSGATYDVILTNPPYVNEQSMRDLPAEYLAEPRIALAGGDDGMDIVRRIVAGAKKRLNPGGVLVVEIGNEHANVQAAFPELDIVWLSVSAGDDQVFLVTYDALPD
jgi:ribosomal protein L3 glutamine methyltransferase